LLENKKGVDSGVHRIRKGHITSVLKVLEKVDKGSMSNEHHINEGLLKCYQWKRLID